MGALYRSLFLILPCAEKKTFKVLFCLYNMDVSALDACNMLSVLTA